MALVPECHSTRIESLFESQSALAPFPRVDGGEKRGHFGGTLWAIALMFNGGEGSRQS